MECGIDLRGSGEHGGERQTVMLWDGRHRTDSHVHRSTVAIMLPTRRHTAAPMGQRLHLDRHRIGLRPMSAFIDLQPGQAVAVNWTAREYHADLECESRSQLMDLDVSPALCYAKHEARTMQTPETAAMRLGTWTHMATLEPDEWARRLYPQPPIRPPGSDGRARKDTPAKQLYNVWKMAMGMWEERQTPESIILGHDDLERVTQMSSAVRRHPEAAQLLDAPGPTEQTIVWRHPTGVLIRVRVDKLAILDPGTVYVPDLKTTVDPSLGPFGRTISKHGYHVQGAFYTDAVKALYPDAEVVFVFVAVRSSPMFEVGVYPLAERAEDLGRTIYEELLTELVRRRADDDWLAEWQVGLHEVDLPEYAYRER